MSVNLNSRKVCWQRLEEVQFDTVGLAGAIADSNIGAVGAQMFGCNNSKPSRLLSNKQFNEEADIVEVDHSVAIDICFVEEITSLQNRNE